MFKEGDGVSLKYLTTFHANRSPSDVLSGEQLRMCADTLAEVVRVGAGGRLLLACSGAYAWVYPDAVEPLRCAAAERTAK